MGNNNKFSFFQKLFKNNEKDEKEKKVTPKFLLILLILGVLLMFSSNLFPVKKEEIPVLKPETGQESPENVPTFGGKDNDNMSTIEKYEKAYEQELKAALEEVAGVKDVSIEINLDSSEEKVLERDIVRRSQMTDETDKEKESKLAMILGVAVVGVLSFIFGKVIFTAVPAMLAELTRPIVPSHTGQIIVETVIKLILLLSYIYFVSLTPIIKRVFQYHGAEHKVINAYENNLPLTVENVQKQTRLHYRCGSSFILFTVFIGMFVYFLVPTDPLWLRVVNRILLIPVVLGISFEVLQFTNRLRNVPVLKAIGYPGLWLQLLTTKEPTDDQVEVAIASFEELLRLEGKQS